MEPIRSRYLTLLAKYRVGRREARLKTPLCSRLLMLTLAWRYRSRIAAQSWNYEGRRGLLFSYTFSQLALGYMKDVVQRVGIGGQALGLTKG